MPIRQVSEQKSPLKGLKEERDKLIEDIQKMNDRLNYMNRFIADMQKEKF